MRKELEKLKIEIDQFYWDNCFGKCIGGCNDCKVLVNTDSGEECYMEYITDRLESIYSE